ncbi:TlpA disulfide reductase family protein [Chitinophaga sp. CC14]|uniref:TlpA family protein disulfide reductase n=1 Tax=Chitinophaga sp. CC14 TaxID=3029199 RepID=UPI003B7FC7B6
MLKRKSLILALFICLIHFAPIIMVKARAVPGKKTNAPARFKGIIRNFRGSADSIGIELARNVVVEASGSANLSKFVLMNVHPAKDGTFSFELPTSSEPGKLTLSMVQYNPDKDRMEPFISDSYGYIVEPGDNLFLDITYEPSQNNVLIKFSGKGSEKYNCMAEIKAEMNRQNKIVGEKWGSALANKNYDYILGKEFLDVNTHCYQAALKVLDSYRNKISPTAYDVMNADIYGTTYGGLISDYQSQMSDTRNPIEVRKKVYDYASSIDLPPLNPEHDIKKDNNYAFSLQYKYWYFINSRIIRLLKFGEKVTFSFPDLFDNIYKDKTISGFLKEKLLAECLILPYVMLYAVQDQLGYESCYQKALLFIKTSYIKNYLLANNRTKRGGIPYNFAFNDQSGKVVHLSDFAGKVIFQDTWSTGCTGCAVFHQLFEKEIYPKFKDNPDFVMISINSDRTKEMWLKSMQTDKYTSPQYINLHANRQGSEDDPMSVYYRSNLAPFLLIVDKQGKIFSRLYPTAPEDIIRNINEALSQKKKGPSLQTQMER